MNKIKQIGKRLVKNAQAVSPVIATLMLVLVAVGSAGAFYVWQAGWQEDVNSKVGSPELQSSIKIGGSSTVWEYTAMAKELFELQNPSYRIDLQKGGSTSGIQAAGWGLVDIGASSSDPTGKFAKYNLPDFDQDGTRDIGLPPMQKHQVGYDGVIVVISADNLHGLISINRSNLVDIYNGDITDWSSVPTEVNGSTMCSAGAISTHDRADHSGTEECFVDKICDGDVINTGDQMDGLATHSHYSNQNLKTAIAADPDGIGFIPYGALDSTVTEIGFSIELETPAKASRDDIKSGDWVGSRGLFFITVGNPSGDAKRFIDFCLTPDVNQQICKAVGYESIFG